MVCFSTCYFCWWDGWGRGGREEIIEKVMIWGAKEKPCKWPACNPGAREVELRSSG